jgi:DNA end-binding protein Ku
MQINSDSLELAESLISKRSGKFDLSKFEDGYEIAVKELVDAKINHLPVPKDEMPKAESGKVVNLMDALRKSLSTSTPPAKSAKKPVASEKTAAPRKGIGLVKPKGGTKQRSA